MLACLSSFSIKALSFTPVTLGIQQNGGEQKYNTLGNAVCVSISATPALAHASSMALFYRQELGVSAVTRAGN